MDLAIDFNPATYEDIKRRCEEGFADLVSNINKTINTLKALPGLTAQIWKPVLDWLQDAAIQVGNFLKDLGQGLAAPVMFFLYAFQWANDVGRPMSDVDTNLSPETGNLPLSFDPTQWTGEAADAYKLRTATQPDAAAKISARAWYVAVALGTLAAAGLTFYAIVIQQIVAMIVGIVAATAATVGTAGVAAPSIPAVILATLAPIGIAIGVLAVTEVAAAVAFSQWTTPEGVFLNGAWPQGTFNYAP